MKLHTDFGTGNTSIGDEVIRTPDGEAKLSRCPCGRDLRPPEKELCHVCIEQRPAYQVRPK